MDKMNQIEAIKIMEFDLKEEANEESLKKQYRKMVMKYHPDRNKGDSKQFLKIKQAYDILLEAIKIRNMPRPQTIVIDFGNFRGNYYDTTGTNTSWSFNFG